MVEAILPKEQYQIFVDDFESMNLKQLNFCLEGANCELGQISKSVLILGFIIAINLAIGISIALFSKVPYFGFLNVAIASWIYYSLYRLMLVQEIVFMELIEIIKTAIKDRFEDKKNLSK